MLTENSINDFLGKLDKFKAIAEQCKLESLSVYLPETDEEIEKIHFVCLGVNVKILKISAEIRQLCDFDFFVFDHGNLKVEMKEKLLEKEAAVVVTASNKIKIQALLTIQLNRQQQKEESQQNDFGCH